MRLHEPVAEGDLVGWKDPRTPKQGAHLARVRDVAGPWVLVEPEYGPRRGRRYWVLDRKLVITPPKPDPMWHARALLKLAGILPLEEGDPDLLPDLASPAWLNCRVCKQPLHQIRGKGAVKATAPVKKWLYCTECDRMQRLP
ncbi:MAG: hypothetical protein ACYC2H_10680 [Thermoplasmatota archaeon]